MVFEPDIHWHYCGKLRRVLEDAACEYCARIIVATLEAQPRERVYLCVPVADQETFQEALRRLLGAAWHRLSVFSGTADNFRSQFPRQTFWQRLSRSPPHGGGTGVMLAIAAPPRYGSAKGLAPADECRRMAQFARRQAYEVVELPEPRLSLEDGLAIIRTAPSKILDGSHSSETELEEQIERGAEVSPVGFMLRDAWRMLKTGAVPELLFLREFEARVAMIDPAMREAVPWSTIIDFWRTILRDIEGSREYANRWYDKIRSRRNGWVDLEDIHDLVLYEHSIYALHAEVDPVCLSYPVAYYGSWWLRGRIAFASLFGSSASIGDDRPVAWD
jgi:hypothetical protein